jgi:large subunit ribosomal protein L13
VHIDVGDHVVVVNAAKIRVTGDKLETKVYARHSGYPGGFRKRWGPSEARRRCAPGCQGLLPHNRLRAQLRKLKVYAGPASPGPDAEPQGQEVVANSTAFFEHGPSQEASRVYT